MEKLKRNFREESNIQCRWMRNEDEKWKNFKKPFETLENLIRKFLIYSQCQTANSGNEQLDTEKYEKNCVSE